MERDRPESVSDGTVRAHPSGSLQSGMDLGLRGHPLGEQLSTIHLRIREELPGIDRVGVAFYDPRTDVLRTFVHSADAQSPLARHEILLSRTPSLLALAESPRTRVLTDLSFLVPPKDGTRRAADPAPRSTFTKPLVSDGQLAGFLFFDSGAPGFFDGPVVARLEVFADLLSLVLLSGLEPIRRLRSAVHLAAQLTRFRDVETGMHLERVSRSARLIARALPSEEGLDGESIDYLAVFTRAHDIGKVAVPDHVLFKDGALTPAEVEIMKSHVTSGVAVVEGLIRDLNLDGLPCVAMLRSIVRSHHEVLDGSGYPDGLKAGEIPLVVRIVVVADVFDALTSDRPYKETWSPAEALGYLMQRKGTKFDPACVAALEGCAGDVASIRRTGPPTASTP